MSIRKMYRVRVDFKSGPYNCRVIEGRIVEMLCREDIQAIDSDWSFQSPTSYSYVEVNVSTRDEAVLVDEMLKGLVSSSGAEIKPETLSTERLKNYQ